MEKLTIGFMLALFGGLCINPSADAKNDIDSGIIEEIEEISPEKKLHDLYVDALESQKIEVLNEINQKFIESAHELIDAVNKDLICPQQMLKKIKLYSNYLWTRSLIHADNNGLTDTLIKILDHLNNIYGRESRTALPIKSINPITMTVKDRNIATFYCTNLTNDEERTEFFNIHKNITLDWPQGTDLQEQIRSMLSYASAFKLDRELIQPLLHHYTTIWNLENLLQLASDLDLGQPGTHYLLMKLKIEPGVVALALKKRDNIEQPYLAQAIRTAIKGKKNRFLEALKEYCSIPRVEK